MNESIYFDYYNPPEEQKFGQITIHDKAGEKVSTINLDIAENEFRSIYLAFKDCSPDDRYTEYNYW